jgi:hypothetical protein
MDAVLQTGGYLERLCRMVLKASKHAEYFANVVDLMTTASEIRQFASQLIPGLLQTQAYCEALFRSADAFRPEEKVREMVSARMDRASLLDNPTTPLFWAVLHETVLRLPVCEPKHMSQQLRHLVDVARSRRIVIQVIPTAVGAYPMMGSEVTLLTFPDAPSAVYVETALTGHLLDSPTVVDRYAHVYDCARAVALSPDASVGFMESVMEEYSRA